MISVSLPRLETVAEVDYMIGSYRIGIAKPPQNAIKWNTGYASDGTYVLEATARDKMGRVVGKARQSFSINNHGNALAVTEPDLTHTLSGKVRLTISGKDSQFYPALWVVNVDGENASTVWTDNKGLSNDSISATLDTTRYLNGTHELYIAMHSNFWPTGHQTNQSYHNWRAASAEVIDTENGHTPMDILANDQHVYLSPGGTTILSCQELFTDGKAEPCKSPQYATSDGRSITVSSAGVLLAKKPGFATITVNDDSRATEVYVWVRRGRDIPHFSTAGNTAVENSNKGIFIIAPFALPPHELVSVRNLGVQLHHAGVNTLSEGFFTNPRNREYSFEAWKRDFDSSIAPEWTLAKTNDFHVLATGDEVCRNIGGEAWWVLNWPAGKAAVQYAMATLATSNVALGVDMVDEVNFSWGSTPAPPGKIGALGSFQSVTCSSGNCVVIWPNNPVVPSRFPSGTNFAFAGAAHSQLNTPEGQIFKATAVTADSFHFVSARPIDGTFNATSDPNLEFLWWAGKAGGCPTEPCNPPIPNDTLLRISHWLHDVHPNVPISWPVAGGSPISVQARWMGPGSISDYASLYWVPLNLRHTYTWGAGVQEQNSWMRRSFYESQAVTMIDRPQLLLDSISGPMYVKKTLNAPYYRPSVDDLEQPGPTPAAITSSIMTAAALGAAGIRLYTFEDPANEASRTTATIGSELQTGINPTANDPIIEANWRAMKSASTMLTHILTPFVLGSALDSPAYGRNIVTAVRQETAGKMLMIVNGNDWERTVNVDFRPYKASLGTITSYLVNSDRITKGSLPDDNHQTITLTAGETVIYLFNSK